MCNNFKYKWCFSLQEEVDDVKDDEIVRHLLAEQPSDTSLQDLQQQLIINKVHVSLRY